MEITLRAKESPYLGFGARTSEATSLVRGDMFLNRGTLTARIQEVTGRAATIIYEDSSVIEARREYLATDLPETLSNLVLSE